MWQVFFFLPAKQKGYIYMTWYDDRKLTNKHIERESGENIRFSLGITRVAACQWIVTTNGFLPSIWTQYNMTLLWDRGTLNSSHQFWGCFHFNWCTNFSNLGLLEANVDLFCSCLPCFLQLQSARMAATQLHTNSNCKKELRTLRIEINWLYHLFLVIPDV